MTWLLEELYFGNSKLNQIIRKLLSSKKYIPPCKRQKPTRTDQKSFDTIDTIQNYFLTITNPVDQKDG